MNRILNTLLFCAITTIAATQTTAAPLGTYNEPNYPLPANYETQWAKVQTPVQLSWGSTDIRYNKYDVPAVKQQHKALLKAWRGERVNAQAVLWTKGNLDDVRIEMSALKSDKDVIPQSALSTHFVRYVMGDCLNPDGSGCGHRKPADYDSVLVADVLDINASLPVKSKTTQPLWLCINVPRNAKPGKYIGTMTVIASNMKAQHLEVNLEVLAHTLPDAQQWHLNLDLWQNPYSVARYYNVPLWSKEHFDAMRPIMRMLRDAGQYSITTSIMHKPWNGQTEDHFDSMVTRIRHIDGSWTYDYAVFDRWVEFMMNEVGIDRLISCYTMIPWNLQFDYYDEATNRIQFVKTKPGDNAYTEYWGVFLKDFAKHLRAKGWFEKTAISMDERPMEAMKAAIKVIKDADPDFKITLAGTYHDEIEKDLYYYSIPYGNDYPTPVKERRRKEGKISTYYTCCVEGFPNTFTFSPPAEGTWTAIHAVAADYDGYLRWSYNSWTQNPLCDSRFRTWASGDCYSIYPGPRSSIRFERFVEGLQDAEKIYILRQEYKEKKQNIKYNALQKELDGFKAEGMTTQRKHNADKQVRQLEYMLNK